MRPLNHKERDNAFLQFIFVFVGVVFILLFALHYDFEMPEQLTEVERRKLEAYQNSLKDQKEIVMLMDTIHGSIKQISANAPNSAVLKEEAGANIVKLKQLGNESQNAVLRKMADVFTSYSAAQYSLKDNNSGCQDKITQINDLKMQNTRLQTKIDGLESDLRKLSMSRQAGY